MGKIRSCSALTPPPPPTWATIPPTTTTPTTPAPRPTYPVKTTTLESETCDFETIEFRGNGHIQLTDRFIGNIEPNYRLTIRMSFSPSSDYNRNSLLLWQGSRSRNNF